jgi:hypothetical protein
MLKVNGHAHDTRFTDEEMQTVPTPREPRPQSPLAAMRALRTLSVASGATYHVMFLADTYGGCFTHYKKKSHYCKGNECPAWLHNCGDTTWKGYAPVVVWNAAKNVWMPWVLEMTESLEVDLRGIVRRGQVWEIWRNPLGKKSTPVECKLLEDDRDAKRIPPVFDIVPVLRGLYHLTQIDLSQKNPMPPRTLVCDIAGDGPAVLQVGPATETDAFADDRYKQELKKRAMGKQSPTEKKSGRG